MLQNAEHFIEKMDKCTPKIEKAVVFGLDGLSASSPEEMRSDNDYILKVTTEYPDKFIPAGVVDPSWGDKAIKEIRRFVDAGLHIAKIRFTSSHFHANNKAGQKIFAEIEKQGILPVCHSDWSHYSNPLILGDLAMMFPDMKMVMQHFGEYLSYDAISVCRKANNVYVDTSALVHPKNVIKFMDEVDEERVLFASDTLGVRGALQPQDALQRIQCLDLSRKQEMMVLGGNAVKLLKSVGVKV